jgi:hypothetical protein
MASSGQVKMENLQSLLAVHHRGCHRPNLPAGRPSFSFGVAVLSGGWVVFTFLYEWTDLLIPLWQRSQRKEKIEKWNSNIEQRCTCAMHMYPPQDQNSKRRFVCHGKVPFQLKSHLSSPLNILNLLQIPCAHERCFSCVWKGTLSFQPLKQDHRWKAGVFQRGDFSAINICQCYPASGIRNRSYKSSSLYVQRTDGKSFLSYWSTVHTQDGQNSTVWTIA